jgi:adenosylmethionine-8-amino-7-oxononanoate aminotransferase
VRFGGRWEPDSGQQLEQCFLAHASELAAVIIEPVVQGAGGMWFYHPEYVSLLRALCKQHGVLLICDEIATGFGRTGKLFAVEHAGVAPDVLCIGKALTGGALTLAATLTTRDIAETIGRGKEGVLLHGPTFMANPLACAVAHASVRELRQSPWQERVLRIESELGSGLAPLVGAAGVKDVRTLGAIGVVQLTSAVDVERTQRLLLERGVWLRPFRDLLYTMPPFVSDSDAIARITSAMVDVVRQTT